MAKVFMYRHQHAGIVTSHVFSKPPTDEQLAPIIAECERLHGRAGWGKIHEAEFLGDEVPSFPKRESGPARTPQFGASGTGTVETMTITKDDVGELKL